MLQNLVDIVDTLIKGGMDRFLSFGPVYSVGAPMTIILSAIAISTKNEKFHAVFVLAILWQTVERALKFPTMG